MSAKSTQRIKSEAGLSLVEVLLGVIILSIALLGLAAAGGVAAQQVYTGRRDMARWVAMQQQMEWVRSQGYANVTDSSAVVQGYSMSWTVTGTDPKQVTLIIDRENYAGAMVKDTIVTYLADTSS